MHHSLTTTPFTYSNFENGFVNLIAKNNFDDYYEDEYNNQDAGQLTDEYEDDYNLPQPKKKAYIPSQLSSLLDLLRNHKQLGASLLGLGLILTFAGMMLFFEGTLLRLGNICIIVGIPLLVGPDSVRQFFLKKSRTQASIITGIGIFLVFWGKPRLGILFEIFGLLNTMGNMNPLVVALLRRMPVIGDMITAFEGRGNKGQPNRGKAKLGRSQKRYNPEF